MNAIQGTWKNGQIVPHAAVDWPEGTRLRIEPLPAEGRIGIEEGEWSDSPEAIAEWRRWYDSLEPLIMTAEEDAAMVAARREQKDFEKGRFDEKADELRRQWE
jgi:hypothetical protein